MGNGVFGSSIYAQKVVRIEYNLDDRVPGGTDDDQVTFGFSNGSFTEFFPLDVQDSIFLNFRCKINKGGNSISFEFELNRLPDAPIIRYTNVSIKIGNRPRFFGYITKRPVPGEDSSLKFSGYGSQKRIEKVRIKNHNKFLIQSISKTGSEITLYVVGPTMVPNGFANLKAIVKDNSEDKNNGVFDIISNTEDEITILNPAGIELDEISGGVSVLPYEWINPVRFDILFKQILSTSLSPKNQVQYVATEIEQTTGIITAGMVDWEGMEFSRFFKLAESFLRRLYYVGVNGSNRIFLHKKPTGILDKFLAGYHFPKGDLSIDEEVAGNVISVYRSESKGATRGGPKVAAIAQDATSINKYGESPYSDDVPAWASTEFATVYAEALLQFLKDPIVNAEAKNMPFKYYEFGYYGYVTASNYYPFPIAEFDSFENWNTSETILRSLSNSFLVDGAFSHRLLVNAGSVSGTHILSKKFRLCSPKNFIFFMQNTNPVRIRFGVGIESWDEFTWEINSFGNNRFFPYKIDCSSKKLPSREIQFIGFEILSDTEAEINLDFLHCYQYGALHYELELDEEELVYEQNSRYVNLKFGDQRRSPSASQFIAGIKAAVEISKEMVRQ